MSGRRGEPAAAKKRALVTPPAATAKKPRVAAAEPEASPPLVLSSANAEAACAHLSAACPRLAALIAKHGPPNALLAMSLSATGKDAFLSLARSVAYQQLAGKAAATIWGRVVVAVGGEAGEAGVTPAAVSAAPTESLRAAGLSGRKVAYIQGIAAAFSSGVLSGATLAALSDAAMEAELVKLNGVGPWTAHMHMLFAHNRADVLPWGDFGVRKAYAQLYKKSAKALPDRAELEAATESWRPYRSLGAWYMWRHCDGDGAPPDF